MFWLKLSPELFDVMESEMHDHGGSSSLLLAFRGFVIAWVKGVLSMCRAGF